MRRVLAGRLQGRFWLIALVAALPLAIAGVSQASHLFSDTAGHTTLEQKVTGSNPQDGYSNLHVEPPNTSYLVQGRRRREQLRDTERAARP